MSRIYRQKYWKVWEILSLTNDELAKLFPEVKIKPIKLGVLEFLYEKDQLYTQITYFKSFIQHIADHDDYRLLLGIESKGAIIQLLSLDYKELKSYLASLSNDDLKNLRNGYAIDEITNRVYYGKLDLNEAFDMISQEWHKRLYRQLMKLELVNRLETYGTYIDLYEKSYSIFDRAIEIKTEDLLRYGNELELKYFINHMLPVSFSMLIGLFSVTDEDRTRFVIRFLTDSRLINPCDMIIENQFYLTEAYMTPDYHRISEVYGLLIEVCKDEVRLIDKQAKDIYAQINSQV